MKYWLWAAMFVAYSVLCTGLLMMAFYNFWQNKVVKRLRDKKSLH